MKIQIAKIKSFGMLAMVMLTIMLSSCEKEAVELISVEDFSSAAIDNLQSRAVGKNYCLEFVFPITIQFIDDTILEVESYESLNESIVAWFEENGVEKNKENKPSLVFPIDVLNSEGEIISVDDKEQLKELKSECPKKGKHKGKKGKGFKCFSLVFPVTVLYGEEAITFEDKETLKEANRAYKEEAEEGTDKPSLVFPITIEYEDETQVTVESQEALKALKEACKEEE